MPGWLTQEWLDAQAELARDQPPRPGVTAKVQCVVTGGPEGDVRYHSVIDDGHLVEHALGPLDDADLTLTTSYDDALRIHDGELDEQAAYMQGRLKVEGDMAKLLALLAVTGSPEYRHLQAKLREIS